VWQDSLLSITHDRALSTPILPHHQRRPVSLMGLSYVDCMKILCTVSLESLGERSGSLGLQRELLMIIKRRDQLAAMMRQASPHLRDVAACMSMKDQLEYWNLSMHRSYVTSELYRPTLESTRGTGSPADLQATCVEALADTLDAFLGLSNVTSFANLSWAAIHRSLSSALLLGVLKEPSRNDRVRTLIDRLITVMLEFNTSADPSEVSTPIVRSVEVLRRFNTPAAEMAPSMESLSPMDKPKSSLSALESAIASSASGNLYEGSPYSLMNRIIWSNNPHMPPS